MDQDRFEPGQFENGSFPGARLDGADLSDGRLGGCDFANATLTNADMWWAECNNAVFRNATLQGVDLDGATGAGIDFASADLRTASLTEASLDSADCRNANLTGADLTDVWLRDASLDGATLEHTTLDGAFLARASLTKTDLRAADLSNVSLRDANLTGANLEGATLTGANLDGAVLTDATVDAATLADARNVENATLPATVTGPDNQLSTCHDTQTQVINGDRTVGEKAVDLLVANGHGPRAEIQGCTDEEIQELEAICHGTFPEAYKSCLRHIGKCTGIYGGHGTLKYDSLEHKNEHAREHAENKDDLPFQYDPIDFVFISHLSYAFSFFSTQEGSDPPVFGVMTNRGPQKEADSFSEWLFTEIKK